MTDCINEINNTQKNNAKDTDVVIRMFNSIKSSNNYSKTPGSLWQYYRDEPPLNSNVAIIDFPVNNNDRTSFKLKTKKDGGTGNGSTKDVKIILPLKYPSVLFFFNNPGNTIKLILFQLLLQIIL